MYDGNTFIDNTFSLTNNLIITSTFYCANVINVFAKCRHFKARLCARCTLNIMNKLKAAEIALRRYSIYMYTCNVKRELEKSNKRFSFKCIPYRRERDVNVKRKFISCDRVTRAWNRSLVIFHVHAQHKRARNRNKRISLYARANGETNLIHKNAMYCIIVLKEYRDTDWVLQNV